MNTYEDYYGRDSEGAGNDSFRYKNQLSASRSEKVYKNIVAGESGTESETNRTELPEKRQTETLDKKPYATIFSQTPFATK